MLRFTHLFSIEQSCFIHMSGFLHPFISSPVRFRFYQKYSDMQWAIDNFYLGPGCLENCRGHGDCLNEQCICDPGYSGPNCYLTQSLKVILLHDLKCEFCNVFGAERAKTVDPTGNLALITAVSHNRFIPSQITHT